ncbi:MAG: DotI/IcmL/TraM family protein [Legionellales bacterium]
MKKSMLWGALFALISSQTQADMTQPPIPQQKPNATLTLAPTSTANTQPSPNTQPTTITEHPITPPPYSDQATAPIQQKITQEITTAPIINCDYKVPAGTKLIDPSLIKSWSEKAVIQSFDFNPSTIDAQMQKLQSCFTEQGWLGFNSALKKSGNIDAIKTQKLTVSSQIDGQAQLTETKENQWKMTLPLQVVYQNETEKVTQLLFINLTIGRKISGDLGIMQMIAKPRTTTAQALDDKNTPTKPSATSQAQPDQEPAPATSTAPTMPNNK